MLTRTIVVLLSLCILLVKGDLDSNYAGLQALSTDKDVTSDEAPTESMKSVSADLPGTVSFSSERVDAPGANQVAPPDPAVAAASSVEDDEERANSEEGGKKRSSPRSVKPQSAAHTVRIPALPPPQPVIPQPKALTRSRTSKRRSRNNRRQI